MRPYTSRLGASVAADGSPHDVTLDDCPEIESIREGNYIDVSSANTAITNMAVKATKGDISADDQIAPISGGVAIRTSTALTADDVLNMVIEAVGEQVKVA